MHLLKSKESIGIIFGIFAFFSFSILDAIQKTLILYNSVFQLLLVKYFFVLFLALFESKRKNNHLFYKSKNIKLQIFRSLLSVIESGCFVLSFKYLSLANAHSVGSLAPVIVVALSAIILKEKVTPKTWIAIFIGFIGVLIILRPTSSIFDPKALLPLITAFVLGFYQIITKKVSKYDKNETSLFYTSIIGIITMSLLASNFWLPIDKSSYLMFLGIGIFFSLGLYFQIIALSKARASIIQPFHYTLIFWAIIFGYIFYNDIPDMFTVIGAVIITCSGIFVLNQTSKN
ncbi:DMT family transporter [Candidatus Pelagibacter sp.]|jgi:drug/metabolite transporter (DMT)-like permease|nr:DMT family transporter [Candidatus Pelagibacter sp.]MDA9960641.1 DMT family transporter [Candidatus Pelagibacter sp.]MDB3894895.1 DMT family transporter [Candidatus Pelagibacter sp.]MDB9922890.1 DMT family transporter [Candidatus Pelagibacter sp.]